MQKNGEKIYLSGGITGVRFYWIKFKAAEICLRLKGYKVFNPCCIPPIFDFWDDYMGIDLVALSKCDTIYLLKGWKKSRGAWREYYEAQSAGKNIIFQGGINDRT